MLANLGNNYGFISTEFICIRKRHFGETKKQTRENLCSMWTISIIVESCGSVSKSCS